jgi:hypothetical protein
MNTKRSNLSISILIMMMSQMAHAQNQTTFATDRPLTNQSNAQTVSQNTGVQVANKNNDPQIIQMNMPQKSLARRLLDNTTLGYYQQFLGPTVAGKGTQTYNVYQEGMDVPGSGAAPLQSFHSVNLRHQINTDWAIGATLSATNGYTKAVVNKDDKGQELPANRPDVEWFNARAYVSLPSMDFDFAKIFTSIAYEAPTSSISKESEMRYAWVISQSYALNLADVRWNAGVTGQIYRMYYTNNVQPPPFSPAEGGKPTPLQTMIISGGPYVNYRFNDRWMLGSVLTFDYDQRGVQSGSRDFNNNLPHRGRVNLTYFPNIKYLQSVGLFGQGLLKYSPQTTAIGADFSVKF